ncbi:tRNA(Ile)-lysidine synthase [Babesia caballi]|uniref:tRNA(Ile)-lysidine synthetase n=1 Tax=Babesia caballi TaxID=5871 RepID=A0AAV4M0W6_BABCB|nr:tRNA(Ile)-lysidine synthase [Babesia caballi]
MLHALGLIKKHATSLVKCSAWRRLLNAKREDESAQVYETVRRLLENVHVVYFDHRARDDTSTDIEVVRAACDLYGFDFIVEAAAGLVVDLGHDDGTGNFQKAARDWRRGAYKRLIEELPPPKAHPATSKSSDESAEAVRIFNRHVLTQESDGLVDRSTHRSYFHRGTRGIVLLAHHANDSVETFLFKLLRGVHVSNLMGIEHVSYLDSDKDIVLVRPFVHLTKQDLRSFLERVGGTFNEDSSNADSKYLRNRIRNSVVPELLKAMSPDNPPEVTLKTLNKRIRTLAAQSRELRSSLDIETYAFSHYVSSKYGLPNFVAPPQEATTAVERGGNRINWLVSSYGDFYKRMSSVTYGDRVCEKTRKYIRTLQFLRGVGFNTKEVLLIKEWLLVPSELTRKDILYKFCLRAAGKEVLLDHSLLERLSASWSSEPVSDVLKMHFLHAGRAICHQGSLVKVHRS